MPKTLVSSAFLSFVSYIQQFSISTLSILA